MGSKVSLDIGGLESILLSFHGMAAIFLKSPELALSKDEGKALATSIAEVQKHYPNQVIDPKTLAWMQLAGVAFGIYGTRAVAIANNRRRKKAQAAEAKRQQMPENVVPINQPLQGQFPT